MNIPPSIVITPVLPTKDDLPLEMQQVLRTIASPNLLPLYSWKTNEPIWEMVTPTTVAKNNEMNRLEKENLRLGEVDQEPPSPLVDAESCSDEDDSWSTISIPEVFGYNWYGERYKEGDDDWPSVRELNTSFSESYDQESDSSASNADEDQVSQDGDGNTNPGQTAPVEESIYLQPIPRPPRRVQSFRPVDPTRRHAVYFSSCVELPLGLSNNRESWNEPSGISRWSRLPLHKVKNAINLIGFGVGASTQL